MCYQCYKDRGKPKIVNEKTIKASELIDVVYQFSCNGGCAHIVFDDWNIENEHIKFCLAEKEIIKEEIEALEYFLLLSEDERLSALAIHEKIIGKEKEISIMSDNGKEINEKPEEKVKTNEEGHIGVFTTPDGKEHKVVNSVTMMEILVHKLDDGQEVSQVIAQDFMMTDHKVYMTRLLTDAIMMVARAKKQKSSIKMVSKAVINKINRLRNRSRGGAFGKG